MNRYRCVSCSTKFHGFHNPMKCNRCGGTTEAFPTDVPATLAEMKQAQETSENSFWYRFDIERARWGKN
jgi:rubredoxin